MLDKPLLSILIPTKNREKYAIKVVANILNIKDDRFQVVIQDNSESKVLESMISPFLKDLRLRYFYNNRALSFVENFSLGIGNCNGEYLTIIGDDDGINPRIIDITNWAKENSIPAITPTLPIVYFWPSSAVRGVSDAGMISISDFTCKAKYYKTVDELKKLLGNGCLNYLSYNLAKVYHGIVRKSVLEEIKNRTGHYVGGLSPDIYLSVASSVLIDEVLVIDYPLTISGICRNSGSSDSSTGKHTGELSQAPHFKGQVNYQWSRIVPPFYSVESIWADSALAAVKEVANDKFLKYFRLGILSTYCIKAYPQYKKLIIENMANYYNISEFSVFMKLHRAFGSIRLSLNTVVKKGVSKILNAKRSKRINNISDIDTASEFILPIIKTNDDLIMKRINEASK